VKKAVAKKRSEETRDQKAFRILCRLGPLFGAIGLGTITMYADWLSGSAALHHASWSAVYPFLVAIAGSFVLGAILGGALAESYEHQEARRYRLAGDVCFRWSLAIAAFFALLPFANFDENLPRLGEQYQAIVTSYTPALIFTALLFIRGVRLTKLERRHVVKS
jgi:MFS family permease